MQWKPCLDGKYLVSEFGDIKNIKKNNILKPRKRGSRHGYLSIIYYDSKTKKNKTVSIHRVVSEAFIGKKPFNLVVNHIDGNRFNNHYLNLEYVTSSENVCHAVKNGKLDNYNKRNTNRKISKKDCGVVRSLFLIGYGVSNISSIFNVSAGTIRAIINNKTGRFERLCLSTFQN